MEKPEVSQAEESAATGYEDLKKETTIDTIHNDEALKVLAAYHGDEHWEPSEEKRLVRKTDRRLLSLLCITYGLQYYDKAMISQAVSRSILLQLVTLQRYFVSLSFTADAWIHGRTGIQLPQLSLSLKNTC